MLTNEERREIAEEMKERMRERYDFTGINITEEIGIHDDDYDDPYLFDDDCWQRLADLIDPEPERTCEWHQDENGLYHTSCGEIYETIAGTREENGIMFCPYCGREVVD